MSINHYGHSFGHRNNLILCHGTDKNGAERLLQGGIHAAAEPDPSNRGSYWLGTGLYAWENNPEMAHWWAKHVLRIQEEDIVIVYLLIHPGAVLDLTESVNQDYLNAIYNLSESFIKEFNLKNKNDTNRELDFYLCNIAASLSWKNLPNARELKVSAFRELPSSTYQSIRAAFTKKDSIYTGGLIFRQHIQWCIRDPKIIIATLDLMTMVNGKLVLLK